MRQIGVIGRLQGRACPRTERFVAMRIRLLEIGRDRRAVFRSPSPALRTLLSTREDLRADDLATTDDGIEAAGSSGDGRLAQQI